MAGSQHDQETLGVARLSYLIGDFHKRARSILRGASFTLRKELDERPNVLPALLERLDRMLSDWEQVREFLEGRRAALLRNENPRVDQEK